MPTAQMHLDQDFLRAHGIGTDPKTFVRLVRQAVESFPRIPIGDPQTDLTPEEAEFLTSIGLDLKVRDLGDKDPVARAAAELANLVESSLTAQQAAQLLGVDPSRIRQRVTAEKTLYGFLWEGKWRIPRFQFQGNQCLANLGEVISQLPEKIHPLAVHRWFTLPCVDLYDEEMGRNLSPREWLLLGHSPEEVAHIARHLV